MRRRLRQALWADRPLDQQSRDLRTIFRQIPDAEIRSHEGLYQTGLTLRLEPGAPPPVAVELVRCVLVEQPEAPVAHGSAVSFRLKAQGAEVTRIEGLTPNGTDLYRLTFRITYSTGERD